MDDKNFICEIKKLRQIKPNKEWAVFAKERILGEPFCAAQGKKNASFISVLEIVPKFIFRYNKFAFAIVVVFGFVTGAFTFAQNSLPGDPVFILKKVTERTRTIFVSPEDLPQIQLEFANKRLDELNKIAQTNQSKKLAPAIHEFQANLSRAAQDLVNTQNPNVKEIVSETKKIMEGKEKVEALGVVVGGTDDLDSAILQLISREIKNLEMSQLSEEQQQIFAAAVKNFEEGNYAEALEKIVVLTNQQP